MYDSISNVDSSNAAALDDAIAEVWASLFSSRAVASRRAAGVGQRGARMVRRRCRFNTSA